jgi:hypothetical protein
MEASQIDNTGMKTPRLQSNRTRLTSLSYKLSQRKWIMEDYSMLRTHTTLPLILIVLAGCATAPPPLLHDKYRVTKTSQVDEVEAAEAAASPSKAVSPDSGDIFAGTDRRDPKTSVATGGLKSFSTVAALRSSFPKDNYMKGLGITRAPDSERTLEEQYNVSVEGYIYAASKESDNDFHLIVGDKNCAAGDCFINVEVSGLP